MPQSLDRRGCGRVTPLPLPRPQAHPEAPRIPHDPAAQERARQAQAAIEARKARNFTVTKDYAEALQWFRKAAEQGHDGAQFRLGIMYSGGRGVTRDDTEAVQWYRKAAEQGDAYAQYALGMIYGQGRGVPQDYAQAHMWFNLAASRFPPGEHRDDAVKLRDKTAEVMTPAQISEAQKLAREWRPK